MSLTMLRTLEPLPVNDPGRPSDGEYEHLYRVLDEHKLSVQGATHFIIIYTDGSFRLVTKLPTDAS